VAAPREAHHITKGKRIIVDRDHHHRQRTRRREFQNDLWAGGQNNIDATRAQVCPCDRTGVRLAGLYQIAGKPPT
jgi:hypothetical protein